MKARVKATGEIYDIEAVSVRLTGKAWSAMGLDEVEVLMPDLTPDYWTRLEHQYAGMAMQSLILMGATKEDAVITASDIAQSLVENLKSESK